MHSIDSLLPSEEIVISWRLSKPREFASRPLG